MTNPVLYARDPWLPAVIAIAGASGLIGSALAASLQRHGHTVRRLVRRPPRAEGEVFWNPERDEIDAAGLAGVDVVVNLAGENLAQRWSDGVKRRVRESRLRSTTLLARTAAAMNPKPRVFLSGSAVGIYGDRGDETLDETSNAGTDFLATLCTEWEAATMPAADAGIRVVHLRTGLVLAREGGLLPRFLLPFKLGVGGRLASGNQWMSWIARDDYVDAAVLTIRRESIVGAVNLVAPNPVTNHEFTRTLARVLGRPAIFPVPRVALQLLLGEMADDMALASQRVRPRRLLDGGFEFASPTLESALRSILTRSAR